ncbi:MAG: argininosuccinate lyase [Phascolarctobacterium sp.]|nr:argininosuccinate lyase [Phascolarctobacterium sp.]MBR1975852.1 argininosuccinate lyase [Phascolarctobacterium sp.]MBR2038823.1 argininosuccinate lyase [Phascolarctobacterium sp.]MBR2140413.1 argininosuccinate lyase [Phascolarctobacterium sp.]MDO5473572.1 argininosuccinate lyase [Phascolarctobacterium sp.]
MAKLWGGRFSKNTNELVDAFNASIDFDKRLYNEDIRGSIAHAKMLAKCGIIPVEDGEKIVAGLKDILADIEAGNFSFEVALEDIHMNVEARLTERIGQAGARLHTARSRNDQVALDMHMYMKREVAEIAELLINFEKALLTVAKKHDKTLMPGYTHLQRAQPITFAHHLLAYFNMLQRDFRRLLGVWEGADMMPLGAGAIAGTTFPIDRHDVAAQLNFGKVYCNSMDAVSDRDYVIEFLSFASMLMMHMSRLSEEICLWSSTEFGFIELDDAFATGSSMMPQKKNPDIAELVRGKTGRVYGHLQAMLVTAKGLPLTYNKDLQEDKEGFFDAVDTIKFSLAVYRDMILTMTVNVDKMQQAVSKDFSNATDLADYLVRKGLPFRQAHEVVGKCVAYAILNDKFLPEISLEEYKEFSELFEADLLEALKPYNCVAARKSYGGPAFTENEKQFAIGDEVIAAQEKTLAELQANL